MTMLQTGEAAAADGLIKDTTTQTFVKDVIEESKRQPVLVDFWAEWCGPCRMLAPTIEKIAADYNGKIKVGKVDTDTNRDAALKFNITNIPTVIIFNKGEVVQKVVGLRKETDYRQIIDGLK